MIALFLLVLAPQARAGCDDSASTADLEAAITEAEGTISELDIAAFKEATDRLRALVDCLQDPITRQGAADVHRFLGIRAVGDRDPQAPAFFAAARSIQPEYTFPRSVIPEGNPVRDAYSQIDLATRVTELAPDPATGHVRFDGRATRERAVGWPTVFQRFDDEGAVVESHYLDAEAALPVYPAKEVRIVAVDPTGPQPMPARRVGLIAGTATAAVGTAVLYGLAGASHARFHDDDTPDADLPSLKGRTNTLVVLSGVGGAATLGLGATLALTW